MVESKHNQSPKIWPNFRNFWVNHNLKKVIFKIFGLVPLHSILKLKRTNIICFYFLPSTLYQVLLTPVCLSVFTVIIPPRCFVEPFDIVHIHLKNVLYSRRVHRFCLWFCGVSVVLKVRIKDRLGFDSDILFSFIFSLAVANIPTQRD